ncbi:hypothetical protein ALC56_09871, partial [Trachymyrmex septentrionalis]
RYIESTIAEIEDQNVPFTTILFVGSVSDGGCDRLVNDTQDVQSGNSARVLRSLTLRVVEVHRCCDHSVRDSRAQVSFLHPGQNHRGDLFVGKKDFASPLCNNTQRVINEAVRG